jgi:Bacterial Ig-like domain (group 2)
MLTRFCRGLSFLCLATALVGCSTSGLDSVQVTPATQSLSVGQTAQFTAVGTYGNATHASRKDITNTVTWSSSASNMVTVSASGLATAVGTGAATITATATAFNGPTSSSANMVVTPAAPGGGGSPDTILSLTIIPSTITVGNLQDSGQFLAIGTFSTAPYVRDLTNSPSLVWISSFPNVFTVGSNTGGNLGATAGIVTAYGSGDATIIAKGTSSDGTVQTATADFACPYILPDPPRTPGSCFPNSQTPSLLAILTVYNEGLNTTNWEVTAPSATGTPNVLHCGPGWTVNGGVGGSVCTATYPVGTTVTLTAPANAGAFGGWSYNCLNTTPTPTATGPNSCTVTLTTNDTVGAVFN